MKFDFVFDVQSAFRKILYAFTYPGEIVSLQEEASHMDYSISCYHATQILMYMLLDTETNFHVVSNNAMIQQRFSQLSNAVLSDVEHAQFIFVLQACIDHVGDILKNANCGTLLDPQLGSTLIVECEDIHEASMYTLKGPGIKDVNHIGIAGLQEDWLHIRNSCCDEYPLGIDMIFVDQQNNCMVIPRTTRIVR